MKTYKGIIFDLDGTLLDTINDLTDSVNDVMKIYGWKEYDSKACKMMVGNGKIVHASNRRTGIKISPRANYRRIVCVRRVVE